MNRLAGESSPYLRQHRGNPVDWYPWGEEAFARARLEDRPVLLSVGYAACHWCHVMAHESFEDAEIAALQNELFVNIKVDREERPDVDRVYMEALQALTGSGGWPMTVFLLPDGRPYFAGTYFPPEERQGLPAFPRVLRALAAAYRDQRSEVEATAERLSGAIRAPSLLDRPDQPHEFSELLEHAAERLVEASDREHGGLKGEPKFPQSAAWEFLLAMGARNPGARAVVEEALSGMASGGIHDQLGGGFHRYSVDGIWAVPHFEKMLYDNAQLVRLYLHGWQALGEQRHLEVARSTADFLLRDLQLPTGGFGASLDADTGAGEGAYYRWTGDQLEAALGREPSLLARQLFDPAPLGDGGYVLRGVSDLERLAGRTGLALPELQQRRAQLVQSLAQTRSQRVEPARDDKLVVGWNALAIRALAELAVALGEPGYLDAAVKAADAIRSARSAPGLPRLVENGRGRLTATLQDVANLGLAGLALHEATGDSSWFQLAREMAELGDEEYCDPAGPGWYDTPQGHDPNLVVRPKTLEDSPEPSGTAQQVQLLLRLHALTGDSRHFDAAASVLRALGPSLTRYPAAFGALLEGAWLAERGLVELALVVPPGTSHLSLLRQARSHHLPQLVVGVAGVPALGSAPALTRDRDPIGVAATAFVCSNFACRRPVTEPAALQAELEEAAAPA